MKIYRLLFVCLFVGLFGSCKGKVQQTEVFNSIPDVAEITLSSPIEIFIEEEPEISETVHKLIEYGLVNIRDYSTEILVEIKYATTDNFTEQIIYTDLTEAWMLPHVAERLSQVQEHLTTLHPGYRLLIYDAARPVSAQRKLFDLVKGTPKSRYVASPSRTGLHNYGAAIDLTIVDEFNMPLDMGTEFDHLGREAHTNIEEQLMAEGKLTQENISNRRLLRDVMRKEGFRVLSNEWWHFNACSLEEAKRKYKLLDF